MADDPKPPQPAASPPPKPEGAPPAAAAPAAGKGKSPILLIAAGCGGIVLLVVLVVVVWVAMSFFGGGLRMPGAGPDLKTPEAAAKSYALFEAEQAVIIAEATADRRGKDLAQSRELLPWLADAAEAEKDIKKTEAWIEAYRKHRSELSKFDVSVVDVKDAEGIKLVRVKVTGKRLDADGEGWKLGDRSDEQTIRLTQIEGKWKVKQ